MSRALLLASLLLIALATAAAVAAAASNEEKGLLDKPQEKSRGTFRSLLEAGGQLTAAEVIKGASFVSDLDASSFDAHLQAASAAGNTTIVMFFAPWCGHCKKMAPIFAAEAEAYVASLASGKTTAQFTFAALDADSMDAERQLSVRYDAHRGWPTVIVFDRPLGSPGSFSSSGGSTNGLKDDPTGYGGAFKEWTETPFDDAALHAKVIALAEPDVHVLSAAVGYQVSAAEALIARAASGNGGAPYASGLVAIASNFGSDTVARSAFEAVAHAHREQITFARFADGAAPLSNSFWRMAGISKPDTPSLLIHRPYDKQWNALSLDGKTSEQIEEFVLSHKFPLVSQISKANWKFYVRADGKVPLCFIFTTPDQAAALRAWVNEFAAGFRRRLNFVFIDWDEFGGSAGKLGVPDGVGPPAVAIENTTSKMKWAMPIEPGQYLKDDTESSYVHFQDAIADFANSWVQGSTQASYLSEKLPDEKSIIGPDGVMHLVHQNFHEMVVDDAERDVFVEFYAPWCGHCQKLQPVWQELAAQLKESDVDHVVLAKFDRTKNDIPDGVDDINMYPTLKLWRAGKKDQPILYESNNRTIEAIAEWLQEHSSAHFDLFVDRTETPEMQDDLDEEKSNDEL